MAREGRPHRLGCGRAALGAILAVVVGTGCASAPSTPSDWNGSAGRLAAMEAAWRDAVRRIGDLERREEALVDRFLEFRRDAERLSAGHEALATELAGLRQAVAFRSETVAATDSTRLEDRILEIEHRLEGLAAERKAMIEVLEHALSAGPRIVDKSK